MALQGKVVVITGASSGIGRATAHRFAEHGARLIIAARRVGPIDLAVHECAKLGGQATAIQADVTDPGSIENLARRAVQSYGRLDIWVNNAAVALYARVDEGPLEAHRRVIETNLLGYLYGSRQLCAFFANKVEAFWSMFPQPSPMSGSLIRVPTWPVSLGFGLTELTEVHERKLASGGDGRCPSDSDFLSSLLDNGRAIYIALTYSVFALGPFFGFGGLPGMSPIERNCIYNSRP